MSNVTLTWPQFKLFIDARKVPVQWVDLGDTYRLWAYDGPMSVQATIEKDSGEDHTDFENNYKSSGNKTPKQQVVTQAELDNKSLRTFWVHGVTDETGLVTFAVKVPSNSRYVAFGDAEFEDREFLDYVKTMSVEDRDRLIAWQIAMSIDPQATEPVPDAVVQANGFPNYPVVGHYDERENLSGNFSSGTIVRGMAMTFKYGVTEAQPVGGYALIPGGFYFVIECQKETAVAGKRCKVSIDWAEPATSEDL